MYTRLEGLVKTLRSASGSGMWHAYTFAWSFWRLFGICLASGWVGLAVAVPIAILAAPGLLWLRAHTACNGGPIPEGEPQMPTSTPTRTRGDTTPAKRRKRSSCLGRYREVTTGATRVIVALAAPAGATLVV